MLKPYFNFIYNLYITAAEDVQQFFPEWVKEHPKIKNVKKLNDIAKYIPIENFRKPIDISLDKIKISDRHERVSALYNLFNDISSRCDELTSSLKLSNINETLLNAFQVIINGVEDSFTSGIKEMVDESFKTEKINSILITNKSIKESFNVETLKGIFQKTIFIPEKTSIATACKMLVENIKKYCPNISLSNSEALNDISKLDSYKRFAYLIGKKFKEQMSSLNDDKFEIVFTSNPTDVLSMSVRSDWMSCQNLMEDENKHNVKAIYSTVSPYVGIIYITNKKDYQSRGEEMVARSLVFYVEKADGQTAIILNKVYTNMNPKIIFDIFKSALDEKSKLPVISAEVAVSLHYKFPVENEGEAPYFDTPLQTIKKNI